LLGLRCCKIAIFSRAIEHQSQRRDHRREEQKNQSGS
jgi:hypothetical protein